MHVKLKISVVGFKKVVWGEPATENFNSICLLSSHTFLFLYIEKVLVQGYKMNILSLTTD